MPEYQVFHQQAVKSFSAGEDNEHQRRWTESQWEAKASNKKFNYDKSRAHLNFGKRIRDAAFFLIIMLFTFAATLLKSQNYVSSRTIQKCVEHVSTST